MDTKQNTAGEILDFRTFIMKFYPAYEMAGENLKTISQLNLWANRSELFNSMEPGWHIDRGILLSGPVGVGKDEMFRLLRGYLEYLSSPYKYKFKVVWEFARPFMKDGYECFDEQTGNIYYEELALTDEITGQPNREIVNHFGTKILIGSEIINVRYKVFKNTGWQTHFSTNLNEDQLERVYGSRCISRLNEMCNIVFMTGKDRRGKVDPEFKINKNKPQIVQQQTMPAEIEAENKRILDGGYKIYFETGEFPPDIYFFYDAMVAFGVQVATEQDMQVYMDDAGRTYFEDILTSRKDSEERSKTKRDYKWKTARATAVKKYFDLLQSKGAQTIFGVVSVDMDAVIKGKEDSSTEPSTGRRNDASSL